MDATNIRATARPDNSSLPLSLGTHGAVVAPCLTPRSTTTPAVNHIARVGWLSTCPDLLDAWEAAFLARVGGVARLTAEQTALLHEITARVGLRGELAR